jgi:hypothetical protein
MTGDESWFFYGYESDAMFARDRADVVARVSQTMGSKNVTITIFLTGTRLMALEYLTRGQKYNKRYFINTFLRALA